MKQQTVLEQRENDDWKKKFNYSQGDTCVICKFFDDYRCSQHFVFLDGSAWDSRCDLFEKEDLDA